jgi:hypothetical protein
LIIGLRRPPFEIVIGLVKGIALAKAASVHDVILCDKTSSIHCSIFALL